MEKKFKHMDLIQGVINRMAANSFLIKGWAVTLVSAIFALASTIQAEKIYFLGISLIPVVVFWILDGYFLWQERLYRELYNKVRVEDEANIKFDMNATSYIGGSRTWWNSVRSVTLLIFYLPLVITIFIAMGLVGYFLPS